MNYPEWPDSCYKETPDQRWSGVGPGMLSPAGCQSTVASASTGAPDWLAMPVNVQLVPVHSVAVTGLQAPSVHVTVG